MKLIDIVKKLPWPDGYERITQDGDGDIFASFGGRAQFDACVDAWIDDVCSRCSWSIAYSVDSRADDYATAIITSADWLAAQEQVEPKEREPGFYWVLGMADWFVAEWDGELWSAPFNDNRFDDDGVFEIDERRIVRQHAEKQGK